MNLKNPFVVLRLGLGLVFLANAWMAWFSPSEFKELIEGSFLTSHLSFLSSATWVTIVGINDTVLGLIFLTNYRSMMKYALNWSVVWLVLVMIVIWEPVDALEHLGFLSMALALKSNHSN